MITASSSERSKPTKSRRGSTTGLAAKAYSSAFAASGVISLRVSVRVLDIAGTWAIPRSGATISSHSERETGSEKRIGSGYDAQAWSITRFVAVNPISE